VWCDVVCEGTGAARVKDGGASGQWVCCVVQAHWVTV
jgi:hypothetical protein